jgi:hypothetical protein
LIRSRGVGATAAHVILAEIGTEMTRFATAAHLCSWARFAPSVKESAGKNKGRGSTGHGNPYLARVLGEAAVTAGKTDTFLGERYRRIARRRGKQKAIVAVGRSILVIVWHLLSDPEARFHDLGPQFYDTRIGPERKKRNHVRQLEASASRSPWSPPPDTGQPAPGSAPTCRRAGGPARPSPIIFGLVGSGLQPESCCGVVVPNGTFFDVAPHHGGGAPTAVAHDRQLWRALGVTLGGEAGAH